jgi:eukaryotic-like serine/threonine-protein kinase
MKTTRPDLPSLRVLCRLVTEVTPKQLPNRSSTPAPRQIQRFEVINELGSGGMGTVYRALDPQLEREVAIKVLAHPAANAARSLSVHDTLDLKRTTRSSGIDLLAEARMMARLSHPNVLPVYEVGLAEGALFVVMEHIEGCDLATWLAAPRSLDEILAVLAQAGRGLAAAHARGIVHRDFKPENVLVGKHGRVCVADFGLSQLVDSDPSGLARLHITAGTPAYMAPELLRGEPATMASDVFAFATAVAEALGCPPGASLDDRDRRLRERGASPGVRMAVTAGLAVDPAARCSLDVLIASIEVKRRRWRRWLAEAFNRALRARALLERMRARDAMIAKTRRS